MTVMTKASGGCGCGCGGCATGGSCGTNAATRCAEGALARPRFFSGQLLTQEDLQLIVDYVVGKNRLRNRYLFGEGVACGLNVTCPPCGGGTVKVAPGYALDCCGNDIHVPCTVELDINALVRELRLKQLDGAECGDPCRTKRCSDADEDDHGAEQGGDESVTKGTQRDEERERAEGQHYCLYVRYREVMFEPVAPYLGDGTCGGVTCEPSRVCEGYSFELRCTKKPSPTDLLERIQACVGDLPKLTKMAAMAQVNAARALELRRATVLANAGKTRVTAADVAAMEAAAERLKSAEFGEEGAPTATPDDKALRQYLADYQLVATSVARLGKAESSKKGPSEALSRARAALKETQQPLSAFAAGLHEPIAREAASELFSLSARYALSAPAAADNAEAKLFKAGAPLSLKQLSQLRTDASQLKQFLLQRLERSSSVTSCELRDRLLAVRIGDSEELDVGSVNSTARASEDLALILLEYLRDCLCLALNPECAPCDDPAVLLACIELRDCKVTDICNMSRRFVLSPANLRYWLPPISMLGKLLERFCCELELRRQPIDDPTQEEERSTLSAERSFFRIGAVPELEAKFVTPEVSRAANAVGVDVGDLERAVLLARHLGGLGLDSVRNNAWRRS